MRQPPKKLLNRPRFAVDINTGFKQLKKKYGGYAQFVSTGKLTGSQETPDLDVIRICNKKNYHVITHNTKDFEDAPIEIDDLKIGIICINLEENFVDKIGQLLRTHKKHENFQNKLIIVGNETQVLNYRDLRTKKP